MVFSGITTFLFFHNEGLTVKGMLTNGHQVASSQTLM